MIRVALVDDQAIVRAGLARILSPADGFEVVAECADGRQAVEELPGLRPDVVLMDIRMPALDGVAATRRLRAAENPLVVLVLTTFGEDEVLWGAIEAGAAGFVLKFLDRRGPDRGGSCGRRWRGLVRSGGRAAVARAIQAGRCPGGTGCGADRPAHRPRARRPAVDGARFDQCRDRRGPARRRSDGEDACRQHLHQALCARPGRRDRVRVRPRCGHSGPDAVGTPPPLVGAQFGPAGRCGTASAWLASAA